MVFAARSQDQASFGLAPLLDVVLLLLIFFVVTTSFTEPRLALELPSAETAAPGEGDLLVVSIDREGAIAIRGQPVGEAQLDARLAEASARGVALELRADDAARHGVVVGVLDRARKAGIAEVGIAVSPAAE